MIQVKEEEDGTFTISWDQNDPRESMFNTWTEKDFSEAIERYLEKLAKEDEYTNNSK